MTVSYNIPGLSRQDWPLESKVDAFYGNPRGDVAQFEKENLVGVTVPWRCTVEGKPISQIHVHRKCAASLQRILNSVWDYVGHDQARIDAAHLDQFDGSFNYRVNANDPSRLSMHSYGIALDWAAAHNPNGKAWRDNAGMLPQWFADRFLAEGWMWLSGKYGTADPMHFQATHNTHPDAPADGAPTPAQIVLKLGSTGPEVIRLQKILGIEQTGTFDDNTQAAVISYQMNNGLDADGIAGKATLDALALNPPVLIKPIPIPPTPPAPPQPPVAVDFIKELRAFLLDLCGVTKDVANFKAKLNKLVDDQSAELKKQIAAFDITAGPIVIPPAPPPIVIPSPPPIILPSPPPPITPPISKPGLSASTIAAIELLAVSSPVANHSWAGRGVAPIGYIKGMAVSFGLVCDKYRSGDPAAALMARANTGDDNTDALSWYNSDFRRLGMSNAVAGLDTLRHLFVLMLGLGMRESSGNCFEGYDHSTTPTSERAEAGLFQQSYDSFAASSELSKLMASYKANPSWGFQSIFREGVTSGVTTDVGGGAGADFQHLCKLSPSFAVESAAIGLRVLRKHWGPVNRKEVELLPDADTMFAQVQRIVDEARQTGDKAMPQVVNNVPVGSPITSKINVTSSAQIIGIAAVLLTNLSGGKYNIDPATQAWIVSGIGIVGPMLTMIWRTWFTTKITPQSLPSP